MSAAVRRRLTDNATDQTAHDERLWFRAIKTEPLHTKDCQHLAARRDSHFAFPAESIAYLATPTDIAVYGGRAAQEEIEGRARKRQ